MNCENYYSSETSPFSGISKFMRLKVFGYLDIRTLKNKISLLSKQQREDLRNSFFIYEGRELKIDDDEQCIACHKANDKISLWISNHASLYERMTISYWWGYSRQCVASHDQEMRIASLIEMLPERFDQSKIFMATSYGFDHTYFSNMLTAKRPNITFLEYIVRFENGQNFF